MPKDKQDLATVIDLVGAVRSDFTSLNKSNTKILERLATLDERTVDIDDSVQSLCRIVRDGNRQPPLTQRLSGAEQKLDGHRDLLKELSENCNSLAAARESARIQTKLFTLTSIVAIITSLAVALKTVAG